MRRPLLMLLTMASLSAPIGCSRNMQWSAVERLVRTTFPDVTQISTDELAVQLQDSTSTPVLLDVRTEEEYAISHLAGAVRVDPAADPAILLETLDVDAPIVTYCSVGYRSSEFAEKLDALGFTNVVNLEGSLFRWANEGRPIVRDGVPVHEVHGYDKTWERLLNEELRTGR